MPAAAGGVPVRSHKDFLTFGQPDIDEREIEAVSDVLRSLWIGTGPGAAAFEQEFASYLGAENALAVNSGTAALHLALLELGVGRGDEVITTAMTFCATVNVIVHVGATPVLCDCDRLTGNILPSEIEKRITPRTRAIIVVHLYGRPCEMGEIMAIADRHDLPVVEDCAHAIETRYHGRAAGTFGAFGCFSFYTTKNITTGDGGMLVARDPEALKRTRVLSMHGQSANAWQRRASSATRGYDVPVPGWKYSMTDIAAAIGRVQLAVIGARLERRREIVAAYDDALSDLPMILPPPPAEGTVAAHHLYTAKLLIEDLAIDRDQTVAALHDEGIGAGVHYEAIPRLSYYRDSLGFRSADFPNSAWIGERTISLPVSTRMSDADVNDACVAVRRIIEWYGKPGLTQC